MVVRGSTALGDGRQCGRVVRLPARRAVHPAAHPAGRRIVRARIALGRWAASGDVRPRRAVRLAGQYLDGAGAGAVDGRGREHGPSLERARPRRIRVRPRHGPRETPDGTLGPDPAGSPSCRLGSSSERRRRLTRHRSRGARRAVRRARAAGLHAGRADRARPRDHARGARLDRRAAGRMDRRAGGRDLPARAARRRRAVRPQRRAELVEELPVPVRAARVDRPPRGRRQPRRHRGRHPSPALRVHRRALLRPARDRGAGPRVHGGRLRRHRLPAPPRGRVHRRRQLRPGRRDLLLRLDGYRAEGDRRL